MDGDIGFFTLVDPDFFDVPWTTGDQDATLVASPLVGQDHWTDYTQGLWKYFVPARAPAPVAGWKVHISAVPQDLQDTIDAVAEVCRDEHVAWKCIRNAGLVSVGQSKFAPPSLVGKICVVYPRDDDQLTRVVTRLGDALVGCPGPRILGDRHHPRAPIGIRWGAFTQTWVEGPKNHMVPGVREYGRSRPDVRGRTSSKPLPAGARRILDAPPAAPLPIREGHLIRRHSAGAVYRAVLEDGRAVVLKEARHHAGFDWAGVDAVTRLQHEHQVLLHLSGRRVAPEPLEYWRLEHSDILVMEWIDGETMARRMGHTHPRGLPAVTDEQAAAYWSWVENLDADLTGLVERLHASGVAHGDLQPTNIVMGNTGPILVDFECATLDGYAVTRTTGTRGFQVDTPDPFDRDRFALARTLACAVDIEVTLVDRRPDLSEHFAVGASGQPGTTLSKPFTDTNELLERLAVYVGQRATPQRPDRLFAGGVEQFRSPLGALDIMSGAAGVLLALDAVGARPKAVLLDWLAESSARCTVEWHGLGVGIEGVALALALLDRGVQAGALIDRADATELPRSLSWARGKAGCAVALTELGQLLGRENLTARGLTAYESVVSAVDQAESSVPGVGLLEGWSGVALSLLKIGQMLPGEAARCEAVAVAALRRERKALIFMESVLVAKSTGRVDTSFGNGTGGFVFAVSRLDRPPPDLVEAATSAAAGCANVHAPVAGLRDGLAGSVVALRAAGGHSRSAQNLEERAGWHCVPTAGGWSVLGEQRLRCSDDLGTGTAGLLAALGTDGERHLSSVMRLP